MGPFRQSGRFHGSDSLSGLWWAREADPEKGDRARALVFQGLEEARAPLRFRLSNYCCNCVKLGLTVSLGGGQDGDDSAQKTQG